MYVLLFLYPLLLGVLLAGVLPADILTIFLFIIIWEIFIYLFFRKFSFPLRPFERINYNIVMIIGYLYGLILYGDLGNNIIDI
jgi:hypothetical protein